MSKNETGVHPASCTCSDHPLAPALGVREALGIYLGENGFTEAGYESPTSEGSLLGWKFSVPNPPAHRRAIRLHDLQHVATGYGTDHAGEGELAAWQLRRGIRGAGAYVATILVANLALGLLFAPRRTLRAFLQAGAGDSLFAVGPGYSDLLERTVGELRELLSIPLHGSAKAPRGFHAHAPKHKARNPGAPTAR